MIYIDATSGIAGNMLMGAFIDAGAPHKHLIKKITSATGMFGQCDVKIKKEKKAIAGTHIDVKTENIPLQYYDILEAIKSSALNKYAKTLAKKTLSIIGNAEKKVHGDTGDHTHFHELGGLDLIADIVGNAYLAVELGYPDTSFFASSVNVGGGSIKIAHGTMPVPPPATLEILRTASIPFFHSIKAELATPTGVGLLAALCSDVYHHSMTAHTVGYGFGDNDFGSFNSFTRVIISDDDHKCGDIIVETNVDDVSGEIIGYTLEKLFELNVQDAWIESIYMKKNRPGSLIKVICDHKSLDPVCEILFSQLGTFGVRYYPVQRKKMVRQFSQANILGEPVSIKTGQYKNIIKKTVEFEDAKRVADKNMIPLEKIYKEALK